MTVAECLDWQSPCRSVAASLAVPGRLTPCRSMRMRLDSVGYTALLTALYPPSGLR